MRAPRAQGLLAPASFATLAITAAFAQSCVTAPTLPASSPDASRALPARALDVRMADATPVTVNLSTRLGVHLTDDSLTCLARIEAMPPSDDPRFHPASESARSSVPAPGVVQITSTFPFSHAPTDVPDAALLISRCESWEVESRPSVDATLSRQLAQWTITPDDLPCLDYAADSRCEALTRSITRPNNTVIRCVPTRDEQGATRLACRIRSTDNGPCPVEGASAVGSFVCDRSLKCDRYASDSPPFTTFAGRCRKR